MAKGKRTPALFEIINRAQTEGENPHLQVPGWWRSLSETAEADKDLSPPAANEVESSQPDSDRANYDRVAEAVEEAVAEGDAQEPYVTEEAPPEEAALEQAEPQAQPLDDEEQAENVIARLLGSVRSAVGKAVRIEAGQVEITLSVLWASVAGGGLILAILAGFSAGHVLGVRTGIEQAKDLQDEAVDTVQMARDRQPDPSVLDLSTTGWSEGLARRSGPARSPAAGAPTAESSSSQAPPPSGSLRRAGWNYLVVQSFRGQDGRAEAERAERFILARLPDQNGLPPVTVEQSSDGSYILLSTIGYPTGDAPRKEMLHRFREQIRQIGKLYRQEGGGYDFRDAYPMRLSRMPKRRK